MFPSGAGKRQALERLIVGPPGGELEPRRSRYPACLQPAELLSEALLPLIILTSLTPFQASPKFTNTWHSPRVIHSPSPLWSSKDKEIPSKRVYRV